MYSVARCEGRTRVASSSLHFTVHDRTRSIAEISFAPPFIRSFVRFRTRVIQFFVSFLRLLPLFTDRRKPWLVLYVSFVYRTNQDTYVVSTTTTLSSRKHFVSSNSRFQSRIGRSRIHLRLLRSSTYSSIFLHSQTHQRPARPLFYPISVPSSLLLPSFDNLSFVTSLAMPHLSSCATRTTRLRCFFVELKWIYYYPRRTGTYSFSAGETNIL